MVGEGSRRRIAVGSLLVAALASLSWTLGEIIGTPASSLRAYASEMAAVDQPHHLFFHLCDAVMGLALVVHGLVARPLARVRREELGAIGLALAGVATLADVAFPMDCSPALSAACRVADATGAVSTSHLLHEVSSVVVELALIGALLVTTGLLGRVRVWVRALMVPWALAYGLTLGCAAGLWRDTPLDVVGLWQRIALTCVTTWWVLLALDLWSRGADHGTRVAPGTLTRARAASPVADDTRVQVGGGRHPGRGMSDDLVA